MIPVNNFTMQQQQQLQQDMTVNELNTFYPTRWTNGIQQPTTTMTKTTSIGSIVDIQQQQQQFVGQQQQQVEDVVISGVSGRFPESDNVEEFAQNLLNGVDMVTEQERRWPNGLFGLPKRNGTIKDISRFDAEFFGINPKQVDNMDPQLRLLLEVTHEAIFDSGINPSEIRGTRTGVFIGASASEANQAYSVNPDELSGYSMTGCATSMLANRLSYFFDFKGPSYTLDTACSSSLVAFDAAINAIKSGLCDYAIVGGVNLLARPQTSLQFQRLGMLSQEGKCKSFDSEGKGYVRSETVGVVFIQRKSTCRRFYAKVLHSKCNTDGAKEQGITFPSGEIQRALLREIYTECQVDPSLVTYVECHGTGTKAGDPQELNAIADIFARTPRTTPLFIGSTKSNMGHPEPASGIAALIKMIISIQTGVIPANLHYQEPNQEVVALLDGRLKVVNTNTKWRGGLMALNSFGFGGANAHVLIQPNSELIMSRMGQQSLWNQQDIQEIQRQPRLFQYAAHTEEGVRAVLDQMEANPTDLAAHALLHWHSTVNPVTHPYRGYTVLNGQQGQSVYREIQKVEQVVVGENKQQQRRPIWYIFSGMGTQWAGMGQDMMKIDAFRQSIIRSNEILKPFNIDLIDIIYGKPSVYERTVNAFVGIASIQIALVDCLRKAGIEADGIIGHSVGELGCAYADKCFTAEEALLAAYYRGKCIEEANLPMGAMAAVGLTWEECQRRCPSGVVPACHNSVDTVTISGPKKQVCEFVEQLRSEGVFAKEVDSSNVAFHSYYMTSIAPALKTALAQVIRTPKQRSSKWISTSIPEQRWETEMARFSSPEYHVNNLCSPVLFQEALKHVPVNAITIEIAPHALLQAILKRSLSPQTTFVALMKKDLVNQTENFLAQLGRLYVEGVNVNSLHLAVPCGRESTIYPVPVNTRFLSPLTRWEHSQQWNTPKYEDFLLGSKMGEQTSMKYTVDVDSVVEDAYLTGHQIDGRVIYPATGYLCLVWKTLAKMQRQCVDYEQCPIVFENVEIHRPTILKVRGEQQQQGKKIVFGVTITPVDGMFELTEGGQVVVTGKCYVPEQPMEFQTQQQFTWTGRKQTDLMHQEEIYKELRLRGYEYQGEFQPIVKADIEGTRGDLVWTPSKWVPFLDGMLQINVLGQKRGLLLPTRIRSLRIDPKWHMQQIQTIGRQQNLEEMTQRLSLINRKNVDLVQQQKQIISCVFDPYTNTTVCGGVEICGLHATVAPRRQQFQQTILERVNFVPYVERPCDQEQDYVYVDKLNGNGVQGDLIDTTLTTSNTIQTTTCQTQQQQQCQYNKEFVEFYLSEIKRYTAHILRKIEFPKSIVQTIQPTPVPIGCQRHIQIVRDLNIKPVYQTEGGKLLELLMQAANIDSTDGQFHYRVQKMFNEKHAYLRAMEEDRVLNYLNKRSSHLKNLLDIVVENTHNQTAKPLRVLEITPTVGHVFGVKVNSFWKSHPQLANVEYNWLPMHDINGSINVAHDEYLSEVNRQLPIPIQRVTEWNLGWRQQPQQQGAIFVDEAPVHLRNNVDLVIMNGCLSHLGSMVQNEQEIKQWTHTVLGKCVRPGGFMLVHEYTNNTDVMQQLSQLEKFVFVQQQQQQQPMFNNWIVKHQSESQWRQLINDEHIITPVALKADGQLSTMFLYRRPTIVKSIVEEKIFIDDMEQFTWVEKVKSAMQNTQMERVWLVSEKSPNSGIVGLVNCLRREFGGEKIRCIFLTDRQPIVWPTIITGFHQQQQPIAVAQWTQLFDQIRRADLVMNVFNQGKWGSFRHVFDGLTSLDEIVIDNERVLLERQSRHMDTQTMLRNACINLISRGDLSSLKWMQSPEPFVNDSTRQVVCQVSYAALNFRDIMLATGRLTPEAIPGYYKMQDGLLGMEFSGCFNENRQRRVMGMVAAKGLATTVVAETKYLWEVPREWTLEEAATVPVAYSTAYYALVVRGGMKQGDRVLIHAGSGAVGQAAIAIALSYGCQVFVTVSSDEKREFLKTIFPGQLTDESFANSRDILFEKHIMQMTQGAGVNLVLNSLAEEKLQASVRVLAQHGRFLEIGKFDLNKNSQLGMSVFLKNISFHGILVDSLFEQDNAEWRMVHQLVDEGIRTGVVRPLRATVFEIDQIEEAFRFMAQGKHIGKVLVKVCDPRGLNEPMIQVQGLPKVWFTPTETYVITGGLGGFGLELTQWIVERGARRVILTSRSGIRTGYQARKIKTLKEEFGAQIVVVPYDVKEESECVMLIKEACQMSATKRIGGVFHLAAVLEDGLFENQTAERFRIVNDVKYLGAYNLDKCTRMSEIMDPSAYFVVFSSVTSGRGNLGQTNYGFANSSMERICEWRRREGRHALAIQWGAIGDVGLIAESQRFDANETIVGGTVPQRIVECLKTLEHLMLKSCQPRDAAAIWSSFVPAERTTFETTSVRQQQNEKRVLVEMIANIMGIKDMKQWRNEKLTLVEMGLDSLMTVEIKQVLEQVFNMPLNNREIQQLTLEKLRLIQQSLEQQTPIVQQQIIQQQQMIDQNNNTTTTVNYLMPQRIIERLNQVEMVQQQVPVFVIHPIEGHVNMLKSWAKHMKYPVFGVQYTQEAAQYESVEQLADFYCQQIEKELIKQQTMSSSVTCPRVHLCGYSFGASVAYEMAIQRPQLFTSLSLLDGSHSYVSTQINTYKTKFNLENQSETEAEALFTFVQQYAQIQSRKEFIESLIMLPTFEQRVIYAIREVLSKSTCHYDAVDLEQAARSFVTRIFISYKYQPTQALRMGQVLLVKCQQRTNTVQQQLGEDYGLGQVYNGRVQIRVIDGDHRSFLEGNNGFQVASLLNEYLLTC
jgi:acyl transferase domain-containing protein/NADPH:quinone reductase-like Zn-dependent oxidoreductase/thioesterase domain-containing protein/acyl carrier protein